MIKLALAYGRASDTMWCRSPAN